MEKREGGDIVTESHRNGQQDTVKEIENILEKSLNVSTAYMNKT